MIENTEKNNDDKIETSYPGYNIPIITSLADLNLTNQTVSMSGTYNYDNFIITNSTINVDIDGLVINANNITIDSTSVINASGMGYSGGTGSGAGGLGNNESGGGGAGYGGIGGIGAGYANGAGGTAYGTQSGTDLDRGSGGGNHYSYGVLNRLGGTGGGLIYLNGLNVSIYGQLLANGNAGLGGYSPQSVGGSGGGSGGGILIYGYSVDITNAIISANGGSGGQGGAYAYGAGGGSGGRIKIFYNTIQSPGVTITVNGAGGGGGGIGSGQSGNIGSTTYITPIGSASFTSNPTGATIWIDGIDKGVVTPNTISNLSAWSHNYTLKLTGYKDAIGTFQVESGLTTTIPEILLQPIPNITIQNITVGGISCTSGCTVACTTGCPAILNIVVTWANSGSSSGTFIPKITIAGGTPIIGAQITILPLEIGITTFSEVSLPQGTPEVCIDTGIIT